jgi:hypothetical protein
MLEQDIINLLLITDLAAKSESKLERIISSIKKQNPLGEIEYKGFKTYQAYEKKLPWHKLNRITRNEPKVFKPIIEFEYDGNDFTLAVNKAHRSVAFTKNDSMVKFFNFKKGWVMFDNDGAFSDTLIAVIEEILEG